MVLMEKPRKPATYQVFKKYQLSDIPTHGSIIKLMLYMRIIDRDKST
jgi:hypothetical protein